MLFISTRRSTNRNDGKPLLCRYHRYYSTQACHVRLKWYHIAMKNNDTSTESMWLCLLMSVVRRPEWDVICYRSNHCRWCHITVWPAIVMIMFSFLINRPLLLHHSLQEMYCIPYCIHLHWTEPIVWCLEAESALLPDNCQRKQIVQQSFCSKYTQQIRPTWHKTNSLLNAHYD